MSSTVLPDTSGLPIAPGIPFRHTQVTASWPTQPRSTQWVVSVLERTAGRAIEARALNPSSRSVLCFGSVSLIGYETETNLLRVIRAALADTDRTWSHGVGRTCSVTDCGHGLPMFDSVQLDQRRARDVECLACRARSVESCTLCGLPDLAHYIQRADLLARNLCYGCAHWTDQATRVDPSRVITPDWGLYRIGKAGETGAKGFGGRRFVVTYTDDGQETTTDNLWSGGNIPEHLRHLFTVNATVKADR